HVERNLPPLSFRAEREIILAALDMTESGWYVPRAVIGSGWRALLALMSTGVPVSVQAQRVSFRAQPPPCHFERSEKSLEDVSLRST
ncbi:MAG: hypothetical protein ACP5UR_12255, partial [Chloroflexus sp.]|uniref:hypothetical protein n=1 Tax=Chloroflexus sp. TaxID=1904827 RepID=UPI003D0E3CE3